MNLSDRVLKKDDLNSFIFSLNRKVFAPYDDNGLVFFKEVSRIPLIDYQNTTIPLKSLFLPQKEALFTFKFKKDEIEIFSHPPDEKRIIFGARPCDCNALMLLDKVFYKEPPDELYSLKRENTIIISLLCKGAGEFCFCSSFENKASSDILLIELSRVFYLNVLTEKGKAIVSMCEEPQEEEKKEVEKKIIQGFKRNISLDKIKISFENPKWEDIAKKCLSCGICTFLCPTCYCFDIQDGKDTRFRMWDSCSFSSFTKMAGDQSRKEQFQRFRNRMLHKFLYFKENFSEYGCVGCGRCLKYCPISMDIIDVINDIST